MDMTWTQDIGDLDDDKTRSDFLFTHGFAHETIYNTLLLQNVVIDHLPMMAMGEDDDWIRIHAQEHLAIAAALDINIAFDLERVDFHNREETENWMQSHAYIHNQIDQALSL